MDKSSNFFTGQPVFKQIASLVDRQSVQHLAKTYGTDRYTKKLDTYKHLLAMLYGVFSHCYSLRELAIGAMVKAQAMEHSGIGFKICRSTLSDANSRRDSAVFGAVYSMIYDKLGVFLSDSRLRGKLPVKDLHVFDSSTITLFSNVLKGCDKEYESGPRQGQRKGGIKVHALMKVSEGVPHLVRLKAAATSDCKLMDEMKALAKGSMVTFDKGYSDHDVLEEFSELGIFYTTRLKANVKYEVEKICVVREAYLYEPGTIGVVRDEHITLSLSGKKKRHKARRVEYVDPESGKEFAFLTNNFKLKAKTIADIYEKRWSIERLFKNFKQNFQLKYFYGDNANAVEIQVWCTLMAYLLMVLFKAMNKIDRMAFSNMMFITRCVLMEYVQLRMVLAEPESALMKMVERHNRSHAPPTLFG